ncbi:MAG: hypothetical protein FWH00_00590, partial [Oscillospiraceae bacterium]|nr:hypothetical protein [Oscillospiraceae bacterium]
DCAGTAYIAAGCYHSDVPRLYGEIERMEDTPATARALIILLEALTNKKPARDISQAGFKVK